LGIDLLAAGLNRVYSFFLFCLTDLALVVSRVPREDPRILRLRMRVSVYDGPACPPAISLWRRHGQADKGDKTSSKEGERAGQRRKRFGVTLAT
jgi:hypothetical protein